MKNKVCKNEKLGGLKSIIVIKYPRGIFTLQELIDLSNREPKKYKAFVKRQEKKRFQEENQKVNFSIK